MGVGDDLPDGLDALRAQLGLADTMRLIERTARWVDPATFKLLPLWYPEFTRRGLFYKNNWTEPQLNTRRSSGESTHKQEGNLGANKALTQALGLRSKDRPNWSCCHIWGVDDALYQNANEVVQDRRYFSCVGNMVLLPTPLKAFTDVMPEVKSMLRICASQLYGWRCDHPSLTQTLKRLDGWTDWSAYPASWPRPDKASIPLGVRFLTPEIRQTALRRMARIFQDLESAGPHYPRQEVEEALVYWKITRPG